MLSYATQLYRWAHIVGQRLLLQFGLHCATHQIRIILVSCVVITSLFYPALAIYASSQPRSLSIIDTFIALSTAHGFEPPSDLVNLWSYHPALHIHEDAVTRAKCGVGRALRVERLLIRGPADEEGGALNHRTLRSTLDLEKRLEWSIREGDHPCLKRSDGRCLVLSPLLFWDHNLETLLSDNDVHKTITAHRNISMGGLPVAPQMVLARRGSYEPQVASSKFDFAEFLAVTYFFPESDCLGHSEHASWLHAVQKALAQEPQDVVQIQEPTLIALEFDPHLSKGESWSALSTSLYLAYTGFLGYVVWSVGNMTAVHSRIGVTFTALVEIACSTITSLSVCALAGFKITMVPWEILPIVIMFVGAENMFNLVDAVCKTPVTLSVKQRIAEGLGRAGTANTFKVVAYNTILGVIAFFSVGAVRQFCSFAIVVLVAHWFLAHTFFLAVLSIDLQRLELNELLRHDPSSLVSHNRPVQNDSSKKPRSPWQKLMVTIQRLLKGRAATNLSLLVLLAIAGTLYYTTYTAAQFEAQISSTSQLTPTPPPRKVIPSAYLLNKSTAWYIWKALNPSQTPLLHLRLEAPNIVTFRRDISEALTAKTHVHLRSQFSMQTIRFTFWLFKIMIFPIAATTTLLWVLLLYLLKDTELVEIQRNRAEPDFHDSQEQTKITEGLVIFSTLPRGCPSDIEFIAASNDGQVVASVGLHNEIVIWWIEERTYTSFDAAGALLSGASTSSAVPAVTCVALDGEGRHCAVGTGAGTIAVWMLDDNQASALPVLFVDNVSKAVTDIQFTLTPPPTERLSAQPHSTRDLYLLVTYDGGLAAKWSLGNGSVVYFTPSGRASVVSSSLVRLDSGPRFLVAFSMSDGTLELTETGNVGRWILPDFCVQAGDPHNKPYKVHACEAHLGGRTRYVIGVATEAGMVSLWDGTSGECISVFDDVRGHVERLHLTQVKCETCRFCGQLPLESIAVAFSVDQAVRFFQLYVNDHTRRCSCSRRPLRHVHSRDILGRRSRSNSNASQSRPIPPVSPSIPRARLATTFEATAFPVSAHGVHSRRNTEKESGRRSSETFVVPFPRSEDGDSDSRSDQHSSPSIWRNAVLVKLTDIACERGGWGVHHRNLVGLRRKARSRHTGLSASINPLDILGLSQATLGRWELWTFDPSASRLRTSLLTSLSIDTSPFPSPHKEVTSQLPFTRVSPILFVSTRAFAGFGNTVGMFIFS